ncbi:hypothetical protein EVAR_62372_1 [Eumeta japonica]|uniref:Uncharacterized protein n=1 Tax=Eumeta variegata TaxID=151549 RepID=A0A4C2A3G9_EUMVA|nr:hypothetical protein EVAR_62372_1 [Eumeta japonica]
MICPLCNNEHGLPDCGEFVKLNMSENGRRERLRMCFRCLRAVTQATQRKALFDEGPRTPDEGSTVTHNR